MFAQMFIKMTEQSEALYGPLLESNRIAFSQAHIASCKQLELFNEYAAYGLKQMEQLAQVNSPRELTGVAEEQFKMSGPLSQKFLKDSNEWLVLGQQFGSEWRRFIENSVSASDTNHEKTAG